MKKLFFLFLLIGAGVSIHAASPLRACSGSSPNRVAPTWADIAACHTAASNGDTITVTAGTYTATVNTAITKYVKIICGTPLACDVTDSVTDVDDLITITESTEGHTRFEGFDITQGGGIHINPNGVIRKVYTTGGLGILLTGNRYTIPTNLQGDFIIDGTNRGVIWDNTMEGEVGGGTCQNTAAFVRIKNLGLTSVWTEAPYYGDDDTAGDKNVYIEGNTVTNVMEGIDCDANCRVVVRYNTLTNVQILNHGADTGSIAGRSMDIHNNKFIWDNTAQCSGDPVGFGGFLYFRGGPALIHDNTIADVTSMAWGDKSEVNFYDEKLRRNAGPWACWASGYPSPYQVGWGYSAGGTQAGSSGVFQDLEPTYLWSNTGSGNYGAPNVAEYSPNECGGMAHTVTDYIQANREYYLATAKSGYNAFTYPHPLISDDGEDDYFVGPSTSGSASCRGSAANNCLMATALALVAAGDTIYMSDGTYTGANSMIDPGTGLNGSAGMPITVTAINDGAVLIDGQSTRVPIQLFQNDYWIIEGVNAKSSSAGVVTIADGSSYNIIRRVVAWDATDGNFTMFQTYGYGTDYNLIEDAAAFGVGRKTVSVGQGPTHTTLRRIWAMWNYSTSVGNEAAFDPVYNSSYSICENCIATRDEDGSVNPGMLFAQGGMRGPGAPDSAWPDFNSYGKWLGCIAYIPTSQTMQPGYLGLIYSGRMADYFEIKDCVSYAQPSGHVALYASAFDGGQSPPVSESGGNRLINNVTTISSTANSIDAGWVVSNLSTGATVAAVPNIWNGGGSSGARVCYRYVDGILTSTPLWPWPMDDRIAAALTAAGRTSVNVTSTMEGIFGTIPDDCRSDEPTSPPGSTTVLTPATGTVCVSGSACSISWTSSGITGSVVLSYLVGGNAYTIATVAYNSSPYSWTVNAPAGTTVKVRVAQGAATDDGENFTVRGTRAVFAQ